MQLKTESVLILVLIILYMGQIIFFLEWWHIKKV